MESMEVQPKRRHSFGGFFPYYLSGEAETSCRAGCEEPHGKDASPKSDGSDDCSTTWWPDTDDEGKSNTSHRLHGTSTRMDSSASDLVGEVDRYWPDTDDEWEEPSAFEPEMPMPVPQITVSGAVMLMPAASRTSSDEDVPKVVQGLGRALLQATEKHENSGALIPLSCYLYMGNPSLDIEEYVLHLHRKCACSQNCFVFALAYISKAAELNPTKVCVSRHTVQRMVLAALTVAAKYHDVDIRRNEFYAQAGRVEVEELNTLEASFLELLAWKLQVDDALFHRIRQLLILSAP